MRLGPISHWAERRRKERLQTAEDELSRATRALESLETSNPRQFDFRSANAIARTVTDRLDAVEQALVEAVAASGSREKELAEFRRSYRKRTLALARRLEGDSPFPAPGPPPIGASGEWPTDCCQRGLKGYYDGQIAGWRRWLGLYRDHSACVMEFQSERSSLRHWMGNRDRNASWSMEGETLLLRLHDTGETARGTEHGRLRTPGPTPRHSSERIWMTYVLCRSPQVVALR
jgi:hypothetical protein